MKRCTSVFTGKFLEMEEIKKNDGKLSVSLYLLCGRDSYRFAVRDNDLWKQLKEYAEMQELSVLAESQTYKDEIYLTALNLVE